ncbi:MAG: glycosyl hydrolase family 79 C-terminal domain-containing protein, partial [Terracidiphilus sp.]
AEPVEIPPSFTGLGYEMSSVATPGLLSPANHRYMELIKGLGPQGVLRAGGIVANYTWYIPDGAALAERQNTVITRASLEQFAAFLEKIGWTAIWSVNFAQGAIGEAVEEARAVSEILGPRLLALEIGNEVDSYGRGQPFRSPSYDYATYRKEFSAWHAAIVKAVPGIRFAAPDTASAVDWVEHMAQDANGDVQLLTTHYYRNGQKKGSADQLLVPDPRLTDILVRMRAASRQSGIPWRMCETNSFSGGGRPSVSDTFAGALWTLNTMLLLAQYGCSGINMETGINQLGFVSSYSPIQDDGNGVNSAGVPYYGMLAFAAAFAGCHQLLPLETGGTTDTLAAYVLGTGSKPRSAVIVNTDRISDAHVSLAGLGMDRAVVLRLLAPIPESKTDVTFGGAQVNAAGQWSGKSKERLHGAVVEIPRMSAAVIRSAGRSTEL